MLGLSSVLSLKPSIILDIQDFIHTFISLYIHWATLALVGCEDWSVAVDTAVQIPPLLELTV